MSRREKIKKALGISVYPWSSDDESTDSDEPVAQATEEQVEREETSNTNGRSPSPIFEPSRKILKGLVENHVRRVADMLERSADPQTSQPGTSRNDLNSAMMDLERIASIKRASNWIKMKKALNSRRSRPSPYMLRNIWQRCQRSIDLSTNDEAGAGTNESQPGTSSNANEEVVTITNGTSPTRLVLRRMGVTNPGTSTQNLIQPGRSDNILLSQSSDVHRRPRSLLDLVSLQTPAPQSDDDDADMESSDQNEENVVDTTSTDTSSSNQEARALNNQVTETSHDASNNRGSEQSRSHLEETKSQNSNALVKLNEKLLLLLECPVCLETMAPPLKQCERGHMVCVRCCSRLEKCPVCRTSFSTERNRAMEGVTELLRYPCRHGCGKKKLLKSRESHEGNCPSRLYKCLVEPCDMVPMPLAVFTAHFQKHHPGRVMYKPRHTMMVPVNRNVGVSMMMQVGHEQFHLRYDVQMNVGFFLHVGYLGPVANSLRFSYKVTVVGKLMRRLAYSRATHKDLESVSTIMRRQDCFYLPWQQAQLFSLIHLEGNDYVPMLKVTVEVNKTKHFANKRIEETDS